MKIKKLVAMLTTAMLTTSLLVGCGASTDSGDAGQAAPSETTEVAVGLATDEGGLNDKSFNQSADEGVKKAEKEFGIKYNSIESKKKEDYEPNLQSLVDNGANLVFGIGFQLEEAVKNTAANNPDVKFGIVDTVVEAPNVMSIMFKQNEGSFLAGVIAGKMTKTNKIGFIGGKDFPSIQEFESGFIAGVKAVNPEAAKTLESPDGKQAGQFVKYADSFDDTNKGYELAKSLYGAGCDVIYHAAGGVGIGVFKATKELRDAGKDVWAIGVDKDQAVELPEYADVILTSMVKRVDIGTYDTVKAAVEGNFKPGTVTLGVKDGAVGLAPTTNKNTPKEVIDVAEEFKVKISNGEITVPATRQEVIDFKVENK